MPKWQQLMNENRTARSCYLPSLLRTNARNPPITAMPIPNNTPQSAGHVNTPGSGKQNILWIFLE